jgi:tRNA modification GTPase
MDLAINQRQAAALTHAQTSLQQVQITISQQLPLDFWTIDLRDAIQSLGEITGEEVTESVLDQIFSRFCIGK